MRFWTAPPLLLRCSFPADGRERRVVEAEAAATVAVAVAEVVAEVAVALRRRPQAK